MKLDLDVGTPKLRKPSDREYPEGTRALCSECLKPVVFHDGAWFDPGTDFLHVTLGGLGVVV